MVKKNKKEDIVAPKPKYILFIKEKYLEKFPKKILYPNKRVDLNK